MTPKKMGLESPRQFWITNNNFEFQHVLPKERVNRIHVIEMSAFTKLEARCAKLKAALEFYANRINWKHAAFDGIAESCIRHADLEPAVPEKTRIYNDTGLRCFEGGKRARAALAEDEGI